jgi:trk system potassium uptake protein TrkA
MAKFIILGAGTFGGQVARTLCQSGHDVLVVDRNKEAVQALREHSSEALVGDATDKELLEQLDIESADAVIVSLGETMEQSILATHYLKTLKAKRIVVKILTEDHGRILRAIGASECVFPERDSAMALANQLAAPNLLNYLPIASGYRVEEIAPPEEFIGKSLRDLKLRTRFGVQVVGLREVVPDRMHIIPDADAVIRDDVTLIMIGKVEDLNRLKVETKGMA